MSLVGEPNIALIDLRKRSEREKHPPDLRLAARAVPDLQENISPAACCTSSPARPASAPSSTAPSASAPPRRCRRPRTPALPRRAIPRWHRCLAQGQRRAGKVGHPGIRVSEVSGTQVPSTRSRVLGPGSRAGALGRDDKRRTYMKLSARNAIKGKVAEHRRGEVTAIVRIDIGAVTPLPCHHDGGAQGPGPQEGLRGDAIIKAKRGAARHRRRLGWRAGAMPQLPRAAHASRPARRRGTDVLISLPGMGLLK